MAFSFPRLPFRRLAAAGTPGGRSPPAGPFPGRAAFPRFSGTGAAGPRRILAIAGGAVAVGGVLTAATFLHGSPVLLSRPGRLPGADPVPGGVKSNPHQDNLAMLDAREAAARAQEAGASFTPQIPSGQAYSDKAAAQPLLTAPPPPPKPPVARAPAATPTPAQAAAPATTGGARVIKVANPQGGQAQGGQDDPRYKAAIEKMLGGWGNRLPRTDVVLPPEVEPQQSAGPRSADAGPGGVSPVAAQSGFRRVLIPAARGVQAHVVMGANSDAPGAPIILEADSGPIARDRLIGGLARQGEYLVIRGSRIVHGGREIEAEWIAVTPDTMETTLASSVDQHYASRFLLPAAASFVQGLGQAFALSNSAVTTNGYGGLTAFQRLNLGQQVGIGAGVAAGRVGQALDQVAPRGPTVRVDRNASVGVVFLADVISPN